MGKKYLSCVMSVSVHLPGRLSADGGKIIPLNIDRNQITNILSLIYEYISHTKLYYMWEKQKRSAILYYKLTGAAFLLSLKLGPPLTPSYS